MRELKFRACDKTNKKMVDTCIPRYEDMLSPSIESLIKELEEEWNYVIMQYTGRKDKNGKEIFEGDIISAKYNKDDTPKIGIIEWRNVVSGSGFYFITKLGTTGWINTESEIIGNVHEHPELIKKPIKING